MSAFHYYQMEGGEEKWSPVPVSHRQEIENKKPAFITVLSVSKLVDELSYEEKLKLTYSGPAYFDWDSEDEELVITKVNELLDKLEGEYKVDLEMCRLYATGGRGYHLEIPQEVFMAKVPAKGYPGLPAVYKEMALKLAVRTLDLRVYSSGRGRMWRVPNVKRSNGRFKVPITVAEMRAMTPALNEELTAEPRDPIEPKKPQYSVDLGVLFEECAQKVEDLLKKRAKFKPDPHVKEKANSQSIQYMMAGIGIKDGVGFQAIATQLAIAAVNAGLTEDTFVAECAGLIESHQSDGNRYNTTAKRQDELRRMYRYMLDNPCYDFAIGPLKALMSHPAPDLDGLKVTKEELREVITESEQDDASEDIDEYSDVAKGVTLARHGVYKDTEFGKKRICAVSFQHSTVLRSIDNNQIIGYETDVLVNGAKVGRTKLDTEVFSGLMKFNAFAAKYGHAFQGTDAEVRTVMMRFVEQAKKKGAARYTVTREGLDLISIPLHEDERLHEKFPIWADANGVAMPAEIAETGLELVFSGYPDPRGVFRTDISKAPKLAEWVEESNNRAMLKEMLSNLLHCQKAEALGKLLGWYTACFWKPMFYEVYTKFPLLHVNGPAGLGKTELNLGIASLFYWKNNCRPLSPTSTNFALLQFATASASIPLIIDEYKPHEMIKQRHDYLKALFRDVYNQRDVTRGGGNRESDDYRMLQFSQLAAPVVFIAEAAEEESAVMERVVLVTLARPSQAEGMRNYARFQEFQRNQHLLGILGQYLAAEVINGCDIEAFTAEFDSLYKEARRTYMLNEEDLRAGLPEEELQNKQQAKERSVFNHTVARFGLRQLRRLINSAVGNSLDGRLEELEAGIYGRLADLNSATTPEYVKVLREIAVMSYSVERDRPEAIRNGTEYANSVLGGRQVLELAVRTAYLHYRQYCRGNGISPLFQSAESFEHALKDSPAFIKRGAGDSLEMPGVFFFDKDELQRLGIDALK